MERIYNVRILLDRGPNRVAACAVYGARDQYHAVRIVRQYGYLPDTSVRPSEVTPEVAAMLPYVAQG